MTEPDHEHFGDFHCMAVKVRLVWSRKERASSAYSARHCLPRTRLSTSGGLLLFSAAMGILLEALFAVVDAEDFTVTGALFGCAIFVAVFGVLELVTPQRKRRRTKEQPRRL